MSDDLAEVRACLRLVELEQGMCDELLAAVAREVAEGKLEVLGEADRLAEADMLRGGPVTGAHKRAIDTLRERLEAGDVEV